MTDKNKASTAVQVELFGEFQFAKVFEDNRDMKGFQGAYESCNGACTVEFIMDKENAKALEAAGSQKKTKELEDGRKQVKLVRKWDAPYTYGGAPQVARADGTAWDQETDGLIGNGSRGVAYVTVYETKTGLKGTRLDGIQVIDLVEFTGGSGPKFKDYSKEAGGTTPTSQKGASDSSIDDDEIPF